MIQKNISEVTQDNRGAVHMFAVLAAVFVLGSLITLIGVRSHQQRESAREEAAIEQEAEKTAYEKISIDEAIAVLPSEREPKPEEADETEKIAQSSAQSSKKPPATTEPKDDKQYDTQKKPRSPDHLKLSNLKVAVSSNSVIVQGKLPRSIAGTCQALLKPTDKQAPHEVHHIEAGSSNQNNCNVSVPHSKLSNEYSSWRAYLSFYSSDKSVKAQWHYISDVSL